MALDPKVALDLIRQKQQLAQEESVNDRTTIKQIKEKLLQIESLIKTQKQEYTKDESKREQLYRLTEDLKIIIPKQVSFMDKVRLDSARLEDFLEVNFARMFTGLNGISSSIGTVISTVRGGFVNLKNTFTSITTQTLSAVKGFIQNSWTYARRFLTLDIKQQLNNIVGVITGAIRGIVSAITGTILSTMRVAFNAAVGVIRAGFRAVTATIVTTIRVMWNTITTVLGQVWNAISGLTTMMFRFVFQTLLRVSSFIFSFVWNTVKWIAGAIAGFIWNTLKDVAATVAQTLFYMTSRLVGTIVVSIMAAFAPYLALIGIAFLGIGYLTGQLSNWFGGILSWFGFRSADDARTGSPSEAGNTFFGWMRKKFFGEGSEVGGWMGAVINWMKDLLGITGSGTIAIMDWANRVIVNPVIEFFLSTTFGNFLSRQFDRFYSWFGETALPAIRTYLFGENEDTIRTQIEDATSRLQQIRRGGFEEKNILTEIDRRRANLAGGVGDQDRNREMLMRAQLRLHELEDERSRLISTLQEGHRKIEEGSFETGILSKINSWWVGENGNWSNAANDSPWGNMLTLFFGDSAINWGTQTGVIGTIKDFIVNDVFKPIVRWFDMNIIPFLNNILRSLADILSKVGGDSLAQRVRETMGSLNRRRIESMSNMGMLSTFTDTDTIMSSFNQTDQDRGLIGRISQMNIEDSERTTLDTARRALTNQMPSADIGISDIVNYIELNPQLMEDSAPMFDQTIRTMKGLFTQLVFASNPEYFGFDQTNRLAFSQRASNYFAQYGVEMTPNSYDTFLENIPSLLGDDFSVYTHDGYTSSFENFQTYEDVWSSMYGQEVVDVLRNMFQKSRDLGRYLRGIFNEIGNGDLEAGMNRYINPGGRDFFENLWADASVSSLATGGLGAAMIKSYFKTFSRDKGTFLNELGFGVGTMRQLLQRSISDADSAADEYFGFAEGGVALPFGGGINAMIAEAGDPEMVIPLNSQGADFIIDTINRVNVGDTNSDLDRRLKSIEDKLEVATNNSRQVIDDPANYDMGQYNEPVEYPRDTAALDYVKMLSMGMFEGK